MTPNALVFAAGRGERLRPLTDVVAKPALPVCDAPLMAWALQAVAPAAAAAVVNASHLAATVAAAAVGWEVDLVTESPAPFGTGGTLAAVRDRLGDEAVTHNGDVISDIDVSDLVTAHRAGGAAATVAVEPVASGADFVVAGQRVESIVDRRIHPGRPGTRFIGVAVFGRRALDLAPRARPAGLTETVLAPLAARGELAAYVHRGYALDVGTPARYVRACIDVASGAAPAPPQGWTGTCAGGVYIGPGADVASGALGPGAIVLAGGRVEPGARVERAVVWPGETVPAGAVVRDQIWFGGRALTA